MKPTDEEIVIEPETPEETELDVREVAESLPAYQEFIRDQRCNEV